MLARVGMIIEQQDNSWPGTVVHYARMRDRVPAALRNYEELINAGWDEPWAALRALADCGCAPLVLDKTSIQPSELAYSNLS